MSCDKGLLVLCCCGKPLCLRQQPALPCLPQGGGLSLYTLGTDSFGRWMLHGQAVTGWFPALMTMQSCASRVSAGALVTVASGIEIPSLAAWP